MHALSGHGARHLVNAAALRSRVESQALCSASSCAGRSLSDWAMV